MARLPRLLLLMPVLHGVPVLQGLQLVLVLVLLLLLLLPLLLLRAVSGLTVHTSAPPPPPPPAVLCSRLEVALGQTEPVLRSCAHGTSMPPPPRPRFTRSAAQQSLQMVAWTMAGLPHNGTQQR
jgi:hypothetical protein